MVGALSPKLHEFDCNNSNNPSRRRCISKFIQMFEVEALAMPPIFGARQPRFFKLQVNGKPMGGKNKSR
jgi:hypothetical protein